MADFTSHPTQHSVDPARPDPDFINWLREHCVPIVGTVVVALLLCLGSRYSSVTIDWTRTKDFTDALANVTQSLALIGGGIWAYFKFAKGRTFQDRLVANVSGKFASIDGSIFLIVTTHIHNVGLSRIAFDQEASSLVISEYVPSQSEVIFGVENNPLTSFRIFGDTDRYIEPNEIVDRQTLIALPRVSSIGYELEFKVLSDSGYVWRATTVVDNRLLAHNETGKSTRIGEKP